jgi:hypothetical protein
MPDGGLDWGSNGFPKEKINNCNSLLNFMAEKASDLIRGKPVLAAAA